ncbi:hypothetical protein GY45DRAFT_346899 [Cubamyces sp. BRFM 1775]|nr:hypothetical protein GY45DRAFT_346899 [Cubamyces sp. BRFM 1775]
MSVCIGAGAHVDVSWARRSTSECPTSGRRWTREVARGARVSRTTLTYIVMRASEHNNFGCGVFCALGLHTSWPLTTLPTVLSTEFTLYASTAQYRRGPGDAYGRGRTQEAAVAEPEIATANWTRERALRREGGFGGFGGSDAGGTDRCSVFRSSGSLVRRVLRVFSGNPKGGGEVRNRSLRLSESRVRLVCGCLWPQSPRAVQAVRLLSNLRPVERTLSTQFKPTASSPPQVSADSEAPLSCVLARPICA